MPAISSTVEAIIRPCLRGESSSWPGESAAELETQVAEVLLQQGIGPLLLYQHASTGCLDSWPPSLVSQLHKLAQSEVVASMLREEEISQVLERLHAIGVQPLLLKGTPLAYTLYPDTGLRPRCDTDLLIPPGSAEQVARTLTAMGYTALFEPTGEFLNSQTAFSKTDALGVGYAFDVHRQISNTSITFSRGMAYSDLLAGAVPIPSLGEHGLTLSNGDALLLACFHRAGDLAYRGERLIGLFDIHLLVEHLSDEEVERFADKAASLRVIAVCQDAIRAASEWFGTTLSDAWQAWLAETPESEPSAQLLHRKIREDGVREHALMELRSLDAWSDRLRLITQRLFPPPNYMAWRYGVAHKALLPYYYFKRLLNAVTIFARR